jgi:hypothetical protein
MEVAERGAVEWAQVPETVKTLGGCGPTRKPYLTLMNVRRRYSERIGEGIIAPTCCKSFSIVVRRSSSSRTYALLEADF